jgi:hypothetical protein
MRLQLYMMVLSVLVPWSALRSQGVRRQTVARYGFREGVVGIDARSDGRIDIAGASGDSAITITVRAADARRWADTTPRLLARHAVPKRGETTQRSAMDEAADSGAAIAFIRRASADTTTYRLFFANHHFGGFPLALAPEEATVLFRDVQRAARLADRLTRSATPRKKPARPRR